MIREVEAFDIAGGFTVATIEVTEQGLGKRISYDVSCYTCDWISMGLGTLAEAEAEAGTHACGLAG